MGTPMVLHALLGLVALLAVHGSQFSLDMDIGWSMPGADTKQKAYDYSSWAFDNVTNDYRLQDWWGSFKAFYYKTYASQQLEQTAYDNFVSNIQAVTEINMDMDIPFWATNNFFADLDSNERHRVALMKEVNWTGPGSDVGGRRLLGGHPVDEWELSTRQQVLATVPDVDWRTKNGGVVTPVKDQGGCGACWAYAATASIESAYLIATKQTAARAKVDLSEQQLIDCATWKAGFGSSGCSGGCSDCAINYAYRKYLMVDKKYPEKWQDNACKAPATAPKGAAVKLSGPPVYPDHTSEARLMLAVQKQPIVIYFTVVNNFFGYSGGIYVPKNCGGAVNHGMVLVGYHKTSSKATSYWIIRNSWSAWWGLKGYVNVQMTGDSRGPCNMYTYASAPPLKFSLKLS